MVQETSTTKTVTAYTDQGFRTPEYKAFLASQPKRPTEQTAWKIAEKLVSRMGVTLSPHQRETIIRFLYQQVWWEWDAPTLRSLIDQLEVAS